MPAIIPLNKISIGTTVIYNPGFRGIAGENLSGHRLVMASATEEIFYASNDNLLHENIVLGITLNAALLGDYVTIQREGEVVEVSWNWTPGLPLFLGVGGALTQTPPTAPSAAFSLMVGYAVTATKAFISIGTPITL